MIGHNTIDDPDEIKTICPEEDSEHDAVFFVDHGKAIYVVQM